MEPASGTIAVLWDAAGQASPSLPDPPAPSGSSQRHAHVTAPPLTMDQSTDMSVRVDAQPVSQSLHYSNAHLVLNTELLEFDIFQPEGFAGGIFLSRQALRMISAEGSQAMA